MLAICCDHEPMFIVMEYMENGNLLEFLKTQNTITLPIHKQINIFKQISNGKQLFVGDCSLDFLQECPTWNPTISSIVIWPQETY